MYDFEDLKQEVEEVLEREINSNNTTFVIPEITVELHSSEIDKVHFEDGKLYLEHDGVRVHGFLHKKEPYSQPFEDTLLKEMSIIQKFHITSCEVLAKMKKAGRFNGNYIFSNTPQKMQEDRTLGGEWKDLRLCYTCYKTQDEISELILYTSEYCDKYLEKTIETGVFQASELPLNYDVDEYGYLKNWDQVTRQYRKEKNFTCEHCGINLSHATYFLESHHINYNKTNNLYTNLKCLCVLCHANQDELHRKHYTSGKNRVKLKEFVDSFRKELEICGNKFLNITYV